MNSPLTYEQIEDKVMDALEDSLGVSRNSKTDAPSGDIRDSRLVEDLKVNSIDYLNIRFRLEKYLRINLNNRTLGERTFFEAMQGVKTVQELIDFVTPICYGYKATPPQEQPQL